MSSKMKNELTPREWVARYGDYLFSLASFKIDDVELARDLVQETFLSAIKGKDSFRGECSEKTWLVRILKNKIIDQHRATRKMFPMSEYLDRTNKSFNDQYFDLNTPGEYGHHKIAGFPTIAALESDHSINQSELKKVLDLCIGKLPTTLSNVFLMKYISGEDADFICEKFNLSQANYWVILHRSKLLLRTCISKIWPR
jgi:RNA polymerase sigma-70 factor (TIGR02943 family)